MLLQVPRNMKRPGQRVQELSLHPETSDLDEVLVARWEPTSQHRRPGLDAWQPSRE